MAAPHRITLPDGTIVCASKDEVGTVLCAQLRGCATAMDAGLDAEPDATGRPDAMLADATPADATPDGGPLSTCVDEGDCRPDEVCEDWKGVLQCFLDCGVPDPEPGGSGSVSDPSICPAAYGAASVCAQRDFGEFRCTRSCDYFDRTTCGVGLSCAFSADYAGEAFFTECRSVGTVGEGGVCTSSNSQLCMADMICWSADAGGYRCFSFCDPGGDSALPTCPAGTACSPFSEPVPGSSRLAGFCEPV